MYLRILTHVFLAFVLALSVSGNSLSKPAGQEKVVFSLEANEQPFKDVAEEIHRKTGYKIIYDEKWENLPVTGRYTDVTLDEFFRRVFRKQNTSLLFENRNKLLAVRVFGDKSFEDLLSGALAKVGPGGDAQLYEDIQELHRQQRAELQQYLDDPDSVDPLSGERLVEIREKHALQREELEQSKNNPQTIEPTSGATIGKLDAMHEQQRAELQQLKENPETVEPQSGMSLGEIEERHRQQRAELERMLQDPDTVDPTSGMKLSEIWERTGKGQ